MKNSVDWKDLRYLCFAKDELLEHVKSKLSSHRQRSFVFSKKASTPAAVLIPLFFKENQAHLLFTKRTDLMKYHKSQISFPGGSKDAGDTDLEITALRETEEEVGINRKDILLLGQSDNFLSNTFFMITPFVGFFDYPYSFTLSTNEIERLIEVPLIHLLNPENYEVKPFKKNGYRWMVHYYHYGNDIIWGVTGFLLSNFLSIAFGCKRNLFTVPE